MSGKGFLDFLGGGKGGGRFGGTKPVEATEKAIGKMEEAIKSPAPTDQAAAFVEATVPRVLPPHRRPRSAVPRPVRPTQRL